MNLRTLTLKYLGWCPGMDNAARFIPDGDIPDARARANFHYHRGPYKQRVNM